MPIPAIIAAAGTVLGSAIASQGAQKTNSANIKLAREQMAHNEKLMNMQNEFSLDMWNRTNEYNDPLHQVDRLKQAGLNPLYYGLDGSSADSFESAVANPYSLPSLSNPYESWQNLGNVSAQLADVKLKESQANNLDADTAKKNNENITETQRRQNMQADLDKIKAEIDEILSRVDLNKSQRDILDKTKSWIDRKEQANIDYTESLTKLNDSQRNRIDQLLEGEKLAQAKTIEEFEHRWETFSAAAAKDRALAGLTEKDIENYALTHMDAGFMGSGASLKNLGLIGSGIIDMLIPGKSKRGSR